MKYLAVIALLYGAACSPVFGGESANLRVSATIPARSCEYPDQCPGAASRETPAAATRVVVSDAGISYVGSPPTVEKKEDLLVVKF